MKPIINHEASLNGPNLTPEIKMKSGILRYILKLVNYLINGLDYFTGYYSSVDRKAHLTFSPLLSPISQFNYVNNKYLMGEGNMHKSKV